MTEWSVVSVLIALVGLVATLVRPMLSLNSSITRLTLLAEQLRIDLQQLSGKNSEGHARLWEKIERQEEKLEDHARRIDKLEKDITERSG